MHHFVICLFLLNDNVRVVYNVDIVGNMLSMTFSFASPFMNLYLLTMWCSCDEKCNWVIVINPRYFT